MNSRGLLVLCAGMVVSAGCSPQAAVNNASAAATTEAIVTANEPTFAERLAAKEVRRYLYLRTGRLLPVRTASDIPGGEAMSILVGTLSSPEVTNALGSESVQRLSSETTAEGYLLQSVQQGDRRVVVIGGATPVGVLRGAYRFVETLGVRFSPSGDIVPDGTIDFELPELNVVSNPALEVRGYFPYHSGNPQGPEYWNRDDYMLFVGQQAKLGMNLIAMLQHHRGDGSVDAVWTPDWEEPYQISNAPFGMAKAFATAHYRSANAQLFPGTEQKRQLSDLNTRMLADVYAFGRDIGVHAVSGGFISSGIDHWKKALSYLDSNGLSPRYIWQHTYENWTYTDPDQGMLNWSIQCYKDLLTARDQMGSPIQAVASGWTIGPRADPLLYDRELPKEVVIAPQVRDIGRAAVDPAYAQMENRPKWVVPWLEDDFNMIAPQLWVRRTLDNLRVGQSYGTNGTVATHWRHKTIEPQMIALSRGAWDGTLDADAFYLDYSTAAFGPEAGPAIAAVLSRVDGKLPRPTDWKEGWPGGIWPDSSYWSKHQAEYNFVAELEALQSAVVGAECAARFEYLLGQMRYLRALGKLKAAIGTGDEVNAAREAFTALLETVSNSGELGDLIFLNLHVPKGKPTDYTGRPRLVVRTPRTSLLAGEDLRLEVVLIERGSPAGALLEWRPLGAEEWRQVPAVAGYLNSFSVSVPSAEIGAQDFEYRIAATASDGSVLSFPAAAAERGHTVVVP